MVPTPQPAGSNRPQPRRRLRVVGPRADERPDLGDDEDWIAAQEF